MLPLKESFFQNLPHEILSNVLKELDFSDIQNSSLVCKLFESVISSNQSIWESLALKQGLNPNNYSVTQIKQELILSQQTWLESYPLLLIDAFGGKANIYKLKALDVSNIEDVFEVQPDQMSDTFMRGSLDGRLFVAYKYLTERGDRLVEVFTQILGHQDRNDWTCTSYHNLFEGRFYYLPEAHFRNLKNFYDNGESELEIVNGLTMKIFRIEEANPPASSKKKDKRSCTIS